MVIQMAVATRSRILSEGTREVNACKRDERLFFLYEVVRQPDRAFVRRGVMSFLPFWPHLHIQQLDLSVKMTSLDLEIISRP